MTVQTEIFVTPHTLQSFDDELSYLHRLIVGMAGLTMLQLEQTMRALDDADMSLALRVMRRDRELDEYELKIDNEVLAILARHCPVANDLRTVIAIAKVAVELEKIGNEIALFAKFITVLFDPKTSDPNPRLLADIVRIGGLIGTMLSKLMLGFESGRSDQLYLLLQYDRDCEFELQEGIRHQLAFVLQDARLIGRALDIMQIMKTLERCDEHCRNIAEYMIFMIEGIDVRHRARGKPEA